MKIDAHQHFWIYNQSEYPWMEGEECSVLRRNYEPGDLRQEAGRVQIQGSVAVQARQSLTETRWLLGLAEDSDFILGVVGWVDLRSDSVREQLKEFTQFPKFRGVRHVVQDEADEHFMQQPDFVRGIQALAEWGLTYDILIHEHQLLSAIRLVEQFPEQSFVLDHMAKPLIREGKRHPWSEQIRELGRHPNVYCKVSGMVTEADRLKWHENDFKPYLDEVVEAFGPRRLMIGSDWPVCLLAASYEQVIAIPQHYFSHYTEDDQRGIMGGNAARFYNLGHHKDTPK